MKTELRLVVTSNEQENLRVFVCRMEILGFTTSPSCLHHFFQPNLELLGKKDDPFSVYLLGSLSFRLMKNCNIKHKYEPSWSTAFLCFSLYAEVSLQVL